MNNNRYQILKVLGQSSLSRTCWALDQEATPPTACVIKQVQVEASFNLAGIPEQLIALQHSGLPHWIDVFQQGNCVYYVQEYIQGDSLATLVKQRLFSAGEIWQILETGLLTLDYLHVQALIHGDVKPENFICRSPHLLDDLVLVDGVLIDGLGDWSNPEYASPEQIRGQIRFASDLYSLGLTCIHLLTGVRPLEVLHGGNWQSYWTPDASELLHAEKLIAFLHRLAAPDLEQRFQTATEALLVLERLRGKKLQVAAPSPPQSRWQCLATLKGHQGLFASINSVAISSQTSQLASASDDKTIRLWNLPEGTDQGSLLGHQGFVKAVVFHPQQPHLLASGSHDRTIRLWDSQTQQTIQTLTGHSHAINALCFSPDGQILISGSSDKTIKLWRLSTGDCIATLTGHRLAVNALNFGADPQTFISASSDMTLRLWDLQAGTCRQVLSGHTQAVRTVAGSPTGQWASAGEDRTIRLWNADGDWIQTLPGHSWPVSALAFLSLPAQSDPYLVSASWDKTLKLWNLETGMEVDCLSGHTDSVTCLALASDLTLVSGSQDKTIKIWRWQQTESGKR